MYVVVQEFAEFSTNANAGIQHVLLKLSLSLIRIVLVPFIATWSDILNLIATRQQLMFMLKQCR